ncbi:CRAL-TRIO domain-containing protein [Zopfochytrium polystomum]|nr:CRAL-TRIO domain-containing protein [Zopfochytrium polystomum]
MRDRLETDTSAPKHPRQQPILPADLLSPADLAEARVFCSDPCLRRYLRATAWDVDKAAAKLRETLIWRADYRPHEITHDQVRSEALGGNTFVNGFDKQGRPIIYLIKRQKTENPDLNVRLLLFCLEEAIRLMPEGVEKVCLIIDLKEYKRSNSTPISVSRFTLNVLLSHYPERLGVCAILNAPWIFGTLWAMVSPFIDPITQAKVRMLKYTPPPPSAPAAAADGRQSALSTASTSLTSTTTTTTTTATTAPRSSPLLELIDPHQLIVAYGGEYGFVYDHDAYWAGAEVAGV